MSDRAYAKQKPAENKIPGTTVQQWQSQLNRSVTVITNIELQETPSQIEIIITTADGQRLRRRESREGNNLIINLVNARLQLSESSFVHQNPIAGISEVRAIALGENRVRIGNFDNFDVQASISSPIVEDKLSFRLSGSYESRDGFTENTFLDTDIDSQSGFTTRGKLLWTPTENLSVAFNASVDDYNDGAQPFVDLNAEDPFEIEQEFDGFTNVNTDTQSVRVD